MSSRVAMGACALILSSFATSAFCDDTTAPAAPAAAPAETPPYTFTGNMTLATEYIFRGIAQTDHKPAIQGGFDFVHSSGFYIGNWNSNISWLSDEGPGISAPIEMDFYGGYKGNITSDLGFDVGVYQYYYPGNYPSGFTSPNTTEVYGALSYGPVSFKYSDTVTNIFGFTAPDGHDTHGSGYADLSFSQDIMTGLTLGAHLGHQSIAHYSMASYSDYRISLTKDISGWALAGTITGTNAKGGAGEPYRNAFGKDLGATRFVLSFGKTF